MIVKCIKNKLSHIEAASLKESLKNVIHIDEHEPVGFIEVGKLYTVYGIDFNFTTGNIPFYYICEEDYEVYPTPRAAVFFEIVDPRPSRYWNLIYDWNKEHSCLLFPEWAQDITFYERVLDGEETESKIFLKYKTLLDEETFERKL